MTRCVGSGDFGVPRSLTFRHVIITRAAAFYRANRHESEADGWSDEIALGDRNCTPSATLSATGLALPFMPWYSKVLALIKRSYRDMTSFFDGVQQRHEDCSPDSRQCMTANISSFPAYGSHLVGLITSVKSVVYHQFIGAVISYSCIISSSVSENVLVDTYCRYFRIPAT